MTEALSMKRKKNKDESPEREASRPRKRLRLEEIILGDENLRCDQEVQTPQQSNSVNRRNKLLTAIQLKKRYKYVCKRHDMAYLIERKRKRDKQSSRQKRDNLVQSFRSLNVDLQSVEDEQQNDCNSVTQPENETDVKTRECDRKTEEPVNEELSTVPSITLKRAVKRRFPPEYDFEVSDGETSKVIEENLDDVDLKKSRMLMKPYSNMFRQMVACRNKNFYEQDSDYETDGHKRLWCKKKKATQILTVSKMANANQICEGSNFIWVSDDDYHCDCQYHDDLKEKCQDHEYELSSSSFSSSDDDYDNNNCLSPCTKFKLEAFTKRVLKS